jgi:hypothetical protein
MSPKTALLSSKKEDQRKKSVTDATDPDTAGSLTDDAIALKEAEKKLRRLQRQAAKLTDEEKRSVNLADLDELKKSVRSLRKKVKADENARDPSKTVPVETTIQQPDLLAPQSEPENASNSSAPALSNEQSDDSPVSASPLNQIAEVDPNEKAPQLAVTGTTSVTPTTVASDSISSKRARYAENAIALIEDRKRLKKLESKVNKLSEKRYSGTYLAGIAELRARIRELEDENHEIFMAIARGETAVRPTVAPNTQMTAAVTAVQPQPSEAKLAAPAKSASFASYLSNIWILRAATVISTMIVAGLLAAYSLLFLGTYETLGNTTSYFPWAWRALYTTSGPVLDLFIPAFAISLVAVIGCVYLLRWILPSVRHVTAKTPETTNLAPAVH